MFRALSEHGRSYSYDEKASGFGRGEGGACLFIKRLDDALRDGDHIHALIRSTACNHSGRTEGITMPNGLAQQDLLWAVHNAAGLDPSDTPVVEVRNLSKFARSPSSVCPSVEPLDIYILSKNLFLTGSWYWHWSWRPHRSWGVHRCIGQKPYSSQPNVSRFGQV